jgi:hypothetical protein
MNYLFKFRTYNNEFESVINTAINMSVLEAEGRSPIAKIRFPKREYTHLNRFNRCDVWIDHSPFFFGSISSIALIGNDVEVSLIATQQETSADLRGIELHERRSTDAMHGIGPPGDFLEKFKS